MRRVLTTVCLFMSGAGVLLAADHTLLATPQSVEWGYYLRIAPQSAQPLGCWH